MLICKGPQYLAPHLSSPYIWCIRPAVAHLYLQSTPWFNEDRIYQPWTRNYVRLFAELSNSGVLRPDRILQLLHWSLEMIQVSPVSFWISRTPVEDVPYWSYQEIHDAISRVLFVKIYMKSGEVLSLAPYLRHPWGGGERVWGVQTRLRVTFINRKRL